MIVLIKEVNDLIKKRFMNMLAKLAVVFIVLSSIPVYADDMPDLPEDVTLSSGQVPLSFDEAAVFENTVPKEEASGGTGDPPCINKLEIYVYDDRNDPDRATNMYQNSRVDIYGYSPEEDADKG